MEPGPGVRRTERDAQKWREGEREPHTEDSFILSQIFLRLLCLRFCFPFAETIALSSDTSLCPPCRHLASSEWRRAAISGHHRHCRYGFMTAGTSRIPGGKNAGQGFNESEASSPGEKCMQMICTHQKDPG